MNTEGIAATPWKKYAALRSGLIVPGLELSLLEKASKSIGGVMHLELEDGVPPSRKAEARVTISRALNTFDWTGKLTLVRVNPVDSGFLEDDVEGLIDARPDALLLAKCQGPEDIVKLDSLISDAERRHGIEQGSVKIAAMIERVNAFLRVEALATASARMIALYMGPSDLSTEVGYRRTWRGEEPQLTWYRSRVICAAHAAGLMAIDAPTMYYREMDETFRQARWCSVLGFDAKTSVSPRQLETVERAFSSSAHEAPPVSATAAGG